jgi:hypothetical protein
MKTYGRKTKSSLVFPLIAGVVLAWATTANAQTAGDFRTAASGDWNSTSTWERFNGTIWQAGFYPTNQNAGVVTIRNGHTVNIASAVSSDQVVVEAGGQVTVASGVTWTIVNGTGTDLTISGTVDNSGTITLSTGSDAAAQSGGKYRHTQNSGTIPTATWNSGSICEVSGVTTTAPGGLGQTFAHFTWNCPGQSVAVNLNALNAVNGNFTIANTGTGSLSWINANASKTIGGDLNVQGGTFTFCITGTGTRSLTVNGDLNLSGGTFDFCTSGGGAPTLNLAGLFNQSGGTFQNSSGVLNFNFTGANKTFTQTAGTLDTANMNFNMNSPAVLTLNSDLPVSTGRTVTVNSGATLHCGTRMITGAGAFTLASGGTLGIGSPDGISASGASGNIQTGGTRTFNTGANYVYNGSAAQVTGSGLPATVANLTIANTADTVTLGANVTVSGTLSVQAGAQFNAADKTITLSAAGTPLVVNGTFTPSTSTVAYTSGTGANVSGGITYYNLTVNSSGDTFTAAADFTVQNVLTVTTGTIFNGNGKTITLNGSGTPFAMSGSFNAASSTVVYASGTGANVSGLIYSNLSIAGNGTFALAGSPTVAGTLALTSGDLSIGANTLNLNGALSVTSGTLTGGGSANLVVGGSGPATTLPAIAGGLNNFTLNRSAGATLGGAVSVAGTLTLTSGLLAGAGNLTLGSGAAISRATGSLEAAPTFAGTVNVTYTATGVTTGPELPAADAALNNLTVNSGVAITLGASVTVNGTLTLAAATSSLLDGGNTLSVKGAVSNAGTHSSTGSGRIRFNGAAAQSFVGTYGNVEIANAAGVSVSGTTTINGNLTVTTGTLTVGGVTLTVNGATSIASTLAITGTAGTKTFGDVTIQTGGVWNNTANETVSIKGNFQCDGSFTAGTAAYTFDGTGPQNISGAASPTFALLTLNNTAAPVTASANFNVSGTFSINGANVVFTPDPGVVINSAAPQGTLSGSGTIKVTRTAATPDMVSQYRFNTYTLTSMTVDYAGAGDQTITGGTAKNVRTSGSGTKTLGGDLTVSGVLAVGAGTILNGSSAILTLSGSGTPFIVNGAFAPATGTVRYTSTAAANTVTGGLTYNNLTIAAGALGDIFTVSGGNLAINGDLTITAGTLELGSFTADRTSPGGTLTVSGSAARLRIGGTGTLPANYATHVIGASSTIEYNGTTQTIAPLNSAQTYGDLITSGSGTKAISGEIEVASTFTIGATAPVVVQSGGVLVNRTASFTLNGTLSFASGATYQHQRNGGTIPNATWHANSTCEIVITGNATTLSGVGQAFGHVTWNSPNQTAAVQLSGALTTVNGNLTVLNTGSGSIRLTGTTLSTLNLGGNLGLSGGTLDMSSSTASTRINLGGDLTLAGTGVLTESGTGTTNTIVFPPGTHAFSNNGSIQNTIHFVVNSGATLNMGQSAVTGFGNFTLEAGGTLGIGSPAGIAASGASGNVQNTGTRSFSTGANYVYNGSAAQVTGSGLPATVNNLTIANPVGVTLNSTHTVTGVCTVESGALLLGTGTINGPVVVNGTIAPGTSIGTFTLGSSPSLNGTVLMEINSAGSPTADKLVVSGNPLTFGGTLVVTNIGAALTGGEQFDLFDASSFGGAFVATNLPPLASGLNWWAGRLLTEGKLVVNRAPNAAHTGFSRGAGTSLKIKVSDLLAVCTDADSADGDSLAFDGVNSGQQGASVTTDGNYVFYLPANNNSDTLLYRVRDQRGGTNAANITITVVPAGGLAQAIDTSGGGVTIRFSGIPGYLYDIERAEDVNFSVNVTVLLTTNAPANGQFSFTDPSPPQPTAYYRLKHNP